MNNRFNKVFLSFNSLNPEFASGNRIIDTFFSYFSFHSFNKQSNNSLLFCLCQLDNLAIISLENLLYSLIITNASIRNNVATSIAYVHICDRSVVKTLHHVVNVNSTETKLFAIRCGINQATNFYRISKIIVIMNLIYSAKKIFDSLLHPFQIHIVFILCKLRSLFTLNQENSIKF